MVLQVVPVPGVLLCPSLPQKAAAAPRAVLHRQRRVHDPTLGPRKLSEVSEQTMLATEVAAQIVGGCAVAPRGHNGSGPEGMRAGSRGAQRDRKRGFEGQTATRARIDTALPVRVAGALMQGSEAPLRKSFAL